eukprot:Sspe_Gene.78019::Locus_48786_Transcript_1_1_Confidence_1.000_Length_392::g.78019::m.78019
MEGLIRSLQPYARRVRKGGGLLPALTSWVDTNNRSVFLFTYLFFSGYVFASFTEYQKKRFPDLYEEHKKRRKSLQRMKREEWASINEHYTKLARMREDMKHRVSQ